MGNTGLSIETFNTEPIWISKNTHIFDIQVEHAYREYDHVWQP